MKKLNEKGFTLIELLAVITIMGILLLVGVPAISKIIFNSRKDSVEVSMKRYANEANVEIKSHEIGEGIVEDGTYSIMKNGNICLATYDADSDDCPGDILVISMQGQVPEGGQVEIFNKKVVDIYNAKIDGFYVNDNVSDFVATSEPVDVVKTLCRTTGDVSFDPGTLYTCEVADGLKYNFRILSTSGDQVTLLMTSNIPGVYSSWFNWGTGNGANYNGCGPVQAYEALSNATSNWNNLKNVTFQYANVDVRIQFDEDRDTYRVFSKDPNCEEYEKYYDSMKARLPSRDELNILSSDWYTEGTNAFTDDGSGYWLNDPLTNSVIGDTLAAHAVGAPHGSAEEVMWSLGIRPVIHVLKSDLA